MTVEAKFLGHAAVQVKAGQTVILIDPFLTGNPQAVVKPDQVKADVIVVTHGHGDHLGDAEAIAKRTGALVIANAEIAGYLSKKGVKAHALHIGGGYNFPFGRVKLTIAHHGSSLPDGSYGGNPAGVLLYLEGKTIYHAGDTGLFYDMKLIGEEGVDLAFLPIGDNYTMGLEDALRAVKLIQPKVVIPMHYDTFPVIPEDPHKFAARVAAEVPGVQCVVLRPGESFALP
jgi:L-ascorbate metabolism protein UlaG (beta-lactamase superfamily)